MKISFENITEFINEADLDDQELVNELFEFLYFKIKTIANSQLRKLNPDSSISPTQLVNECYLKIRSTKNLSLKDRVHFYSISARCMRFYLIDLVRQTVSQKNKGITSDIAVTQIIDEDDINVDLLELDRVLNQLLEIDKEYATITELKFFGGFTFEEISEVLGQPRSTVYKKWTMAKSYLINMINNDK